MRTVGVVQPRIPLGAQMPGRVIQIPGHHHRRGAVEVHRQRGDPPGGIPPGSRVGPGRGRRRRISDIQRPAARHQRRAADPGRHRGQNTGHPTNAVRSERRDGTRPGLDNLADHPDGGRAHRLRRVHRLRTVVVGEGELGRRILDQYRPVGPGVPDPGVAVRIATGPRPGIQRLDPVGAGQRRIPTAVSGVGERLGRRTRGRAGQARRPPRPKHPRRQRRRCRRCQGRRGPPRAQAPGVARHRRVRCRHREIPGQRRPCTRPHRLGRRRVRERAPQKLHRVQRRAQRHLRCVEEAGLDLHRTVRSARAGHRGRDIPGQLVEQARPVTVHRPSRMRRGARHRHIGGGDVRPRRACVRTQPVLEGDLHLRGGRLAFQGGEPLGPRSLDRQRQRPGTDRERIGHHRRQVARRVLRPDVEGVLPRPRRQRTRGRSGGLRRGRRLVHPVEKRRGVPTRRRPAERPRCGQPPA